MVLMRLPFSGIAWLDNPMHPKGVGYGASRPRTKSSPRLQRGWVAPARRQCSRVLSEHRFGNTISDGHTAGSLAAM